MITKDSWPENWGKVPAWTEISGELYDHFLNVLPPLTVVGSYFQCSEPYSHEEMYPGGRLHGKYMTFVKKDGRCWYLGIQFAGHYPVVKTESYKVCFIDGHDLKYKVFTCEARSREEAIEKMMDVYGPNFDHHIEDVFRMEGGN